MGARVCAPKKIDDGVLYKPNGAAGGAQAGAGEAGVRRDRLLGWSFDYEGHKAGVFYEGQAPSEEGIAEYMPVRSPAHLEMGRTYRSKGSARCSYDTPDGRRVHFDVTGSPGYGQLTVANFSEETL